MVQLQEKIEAALMLSSYFETVGFNNATWEFNYQLRAFDIRKYIEILNSNIKINRLKRREEINKYIKDIKKFPEKDGTCIDMLCKEIIKNYPRYL